MIRSKRLRNVGIYGPHERQVALRTAFVSRFIVLREEKKSRAHRAIEKLEWSKEETASGLFTRFKEIFDSCKDDETHAERDLVKALEHAERSVDHFMEQYLGRATQSFADALRDHKRSNELLFGSGVSYVSSPIGWKVPKPKEKYVFSPKKPAKVLS